MTSKRARGKNFTDQDAIDLLNLIFIHKNVIENKQTNATVVKEKSSIWNRITEQFNANHPFSVRSTIQLSAKYENLKHQARKYAADMKQELYKTGGGCSQTTPNVILDKILEIINIKTVEGEINMFDSDNMVEVIEDNTETMQEIDLNSISIVAPVEATVEVLPSLSMAETLPVLHTNEPPLEFVQATAPVTPKQTMQRKGQLLKRKRNEVKEVDSVLQAKEKMYIAKIKLLECEQLQKEEDLKNKRLQNQLLELELIEKRESQEVRLTFLKEQLEEKKLQNEERRHALNKNYS